MRFSDINPGTKLELALCNENGKPVGPTMASEIERVFDDGNLLIVAPFYQGVIYPLQVSSVIRISFCGENAMYSFRAVVADRGRQSDKLEYVLVSKQGEIRKIQRREFFRFDCILDLKYRAISPLEEVNLIESSSALSYFESYTTDISGGGLCFISNEYFALKQLLSIQLNLGDVWISLKGRVVRIEADDKSKIERYRIGITLIDVRERDRQKIIEYIFKQQRNLREKGLI